MGAHFLRQSLDAAQLSQIETGARYQMYGALALMGLSILGGKLRKGFTQAAFILLGVGILFFSFSLYGIVAAKVFDINLPKIVFLITPLGGVLMMGGWLVLMFSAIRNLYNRNNEKRKK